MSDLEIVISSQEAEENLERLNRELAETERRLLEIEEKKDLKIEVSAELEDNVKSDLQHILDRMTDLCAKVKLNIDGESKDNVKKEAESLGGEAEVRFKARQSDVDRLRLVLGNAERQIDKALTGIAKVTRSNDIRSNIASIRSNIDTARGDLKDLVGDIDEISKEEVDVKVNIDTKGPSNGFEAQYRKAQAMFDRLDKLSREFEKQERLIKIAADTNPMFDKIRQVEKYFNAHPIQVKAELVFESMSGKIGPGSPLQFDGNKIFTGPGMNTDTDIEGLINQHLKAYERTKPKEKNPEVVNFATTVKPFIRTKKQAQDMQYRLDNLVASLEGGYIPQVSRPIRMDNRNHGAGAVDTKYGSGYVPPPFTGDAVSKIIAAERQKFVKALEKQSVPIPEYRAAHLLKKTPALVDQNTNTVTLNELSYRKSLLGGKKTIEDVEKDIKVGFAFLTDTVIQNEKARKMVGEELTSLRGLLQKNNLPDFQYKEKYYLRHNKQIVEGRYDTKDRTVWMNRHTIEDMALNQSPEKARTMLKSILTHEVGHHILSSMPAKDRTDIEGAYRKKHPVKLGGLPFEEEFAIAFDSFTNKKDRKIDGIFSSLFKAIEGGSYKLPEQPYNSPEKPKKKSRGFYVDELAKDVSSKKYLDLNLSPNYTITTEEKNIIREGFLKTLRDQNLRASDILLSKGSIPTSWDGEYDMSKLSEKPMTKLLVEAIQQNEGRGAEFGLRQVDFMRIENERLDHEISKLDKKYEQIKRTLTGQERRDALGSLSQEREAMVTKRDSVLEAKKWDLDKKNQFGMAMASGKDILSGLGVQVIPTNELIRKDVVDKAISIQAQNQRLLHEVAPHVAVARSLDYLKGNKYTTMTPGELGFSPFLEEFQGQGVDSRTGKSVGYRLGKDGVYSPSSISEEVIGLAIQRAMHLYEEKNPKKGGTFESLPVELRRAHIRKNYEQSLEQVVRSLMAGEEINGVSFEGVIGKNKDGSRNKSDIRNLLANLQFVEKNLNAHQMLSSVESDINLLKHNKINMSGLKKFYEKIKTETRSIETATASSNVLRESGADTKLLDNEIKSRTKGIESYIFKVLGLNELELDFDTVEKLLPVYQDLKSQVNDIDATRSIPEAQAKIKKLQDGVQKLIGDVELDFEAFTRAIRQSDYGNISPHFSIMPTQQITKDSIASDFNLLGDKSTEEQTRAINARRGYFGKDGLATAEFNHKNYGVIIKERMPMGKENEALSQAENFFESMKTFVIEKGIAVFDNVAEEDKKKPSGYQPLSDADVKLLNEMSFEKFLSAMGFTNQRDEKNYGSIKAVAKSIQADKAARDSIDPDQKLQYEDGSYEKTADLSQSETEKITAIYTDSTRDVLVKSAQATGSIMQEGLSNFNTAADQETALVRSLKFYFRENTPSDVIGRKKFIDAISKMPGSESLVAAINSERGMIEKSLDEIGARTSAPIGYDDESLDVKKARQQKLMEDYEPELRLLDNLVYFEDFIKSDMAATSFKRGSFFNDAGASGIFDVSGVRRQFADSMRELIDVGEIDREVFKNLKGISDTHVQKILNLTYKNMKALDVSRLPEELFVDYENDYIDSVGPDMDKSRQNIQRQMSDRKREAAISTPPTAVELWGQRRKSGYESAIKQQEVGISEIESILLSPKKYWGLQKTSKRGTATGKIYDKFKSYESLDLLREAFKAQPVRDVGDVPQVLESVIGRLRDREYTDEAAKMLKEVQGILKNKKLHEHFIKTNQAYYKDKKAGFKTHGSPLGSLYEDFGGMATYPELEKNFFEQAAMSEKTGDHSGTKFYDPSNASQESIRNFLGNMIEHYKKRRSEYEGLIAKVDAKVKRSRGDGDPLGRTGKNVEQFDQLMEGLEKDLNDIIGDFSEMPDSVKKAIETIRKVNYDIAAEGLCSEIVRFADPELKTKSGFIESLDAGDLVRRSIGISDPTAIQAIVNTINDQKMSTMMGHLTKRMSPEVARERLGAFADDPMAEIKAFKKGYDSIMTGLVEELGVPVWMEAFKQSGSEDFYTGMGGVIKAEKDRLLESLNLSESGIVEASQTFIQRVYQSAEKLTSDQLFQLQETYNKAFGGLVESKIVDPLDISPFVSPEDRIKNQIKTNKPSQSFGYTPIPNDEISDEDRQNKIMESIRGPIDEFLRFMDTRRTKVMRSKNEIGQSYDENDKLKLMEKGTNEFTVAADEIFGNPLAGKDYVKEMSKKYDVIMDAVSGDFNFMKFALGKRAEIKEQMKTLNRSAETATLSEEDLGRLDEMEKALIEFDRYGGEAMDSYLKMFNVLKATGISIGRQKYLLDKKEDYFEGVDDPISVESMTRVNSIIENAGDRKYHSDSYKGMSQQISEMIGKMDHSPYLNLMDQIYGSATKQKDQIKLLEKNADAIKYWEAELQKMKDMSRVLNEMGRPEQAYELLEKTLQLEKELEIVRKTGISTMRQRHLAQQYQNELLKEEGDQIEKLIELDKRAEANGDRLGQSRKYVERTQDITIKHEYVTKQDQIDIDNGGIFRGGGDGGGGYQSMGVPQNKLLARMAEFGMMMSGFAATIFVIQMLGQQIQTIMQPIRDMEYAMMGMADSLGVSADAFDSLEKSTLKLSSETGVAQSKMSAALEVAMDSGFNDPINSSKELYALNFSDKIGSYDQAVTIMKTPELAAFRERYTDKYDAWQGGFDQSFEANKTSLKGLDLFVYDSYKDKLISALKASNAFIEGHKQTVLDMVDGIVGVLTPFVVSFKDAIPEIYSGLKVFGGVVSSILPVIAALAPTLMTVGATMLSLHIGALITRPMQQAREAFKKMNAEVSRSGNSWGGKFKSMGAGLAKNIGLAAALSAGVWAIGKAVGAGIEMWKEYKRAQEAALITENPTILDDTQNYSAGSLKRSSYGYGQLIEGAEFELDQARETARQYKQRESILNTRLDDINGSAPVSSIGTRSNRMTPFEGDLRATQNQSTIDTIEARLEEYKRIKKQFDDAINKRQAKEAGIDISGLTISFDELKTSLSSINQELSIMDEKLAGIKRTDINKQFAIDIQSAGLQLASAKKAIDMFYLEKDMLSPEARKDLEVELNKEGLAGNFNTDEKTINKYRHIQGIYQDQVDDWTKQLKDAQEGGFAPPQGIHSDIAGAEATIDGLERVINVLTGQDLSNGTQDVDRQLHSLNLTMQGFDSTNIEKAITKIQKIANYTDSQKESLVAAKKKEARAYVEDDYKYKTGVLDAGHPVIQAQRELDVKYSDAPKTPAYYYQTAQNQYDREMVEIEQSRSELNGYQKTGQMRAELDYREAMAEIKKQESQAYAQANIVGDKGELIKGAVSSMQSAHAIPNLSEFTTQVATGARTKDGDTIVAKMADGSFQTVRLLGINTPEIDTMEGVKSATITSDLLDGSKFFLSSHADTEDRLGAYRRLLGDATLSDSGMNVQQYLLNTGNASLYPKTSRNFQPSSFQRSLDAAGNAFSGDLNDPEMISFGKQIQEATAIHHKFNLQRKSQERILAAQKELNTINNPGWQEKENFINEFGGNSQKTVDKKARIIFLEKQIEMKGKPAAQVQQAVAPDIFKLNMNLQKDLLSEALGLGGTDLYSEALKNARAYVDAEKANKAKLWKVDEELAEKRLELWLGIFKTEEQLLEDKVSIYQKYYNATGKMSEEHYAARLKEVEMDLNQTDALIKDNDYSEKEASALRYYAAVAAEEELFQARKQKALSADSSALDGVAIYLEEMSREMNNSAQLWYDTMADINSSLASGFSSAFISAVHNDKDGIKEAFSGMFDKIFENFSQRIMEDYVNKTVFGGIAKLFNVDASTLVDSKEVQAINTSNQILARIYEAITDMEFDSGSGGSFFGSGGGSGDGNGFDWTNALGAAATAYTLHKGGNNAGAVMTGLGWLSEQGFVQDTSASPYVEGAFTIGGAAMSAYGLMNSIENEDTMGTVMNGVSLAKNVAKLYDMYESATSTLMESQSVFDLQWGNKNLALTGGDGSYIHSSLLDEYGITKNEAGQYVSAEGNSSFIKPEYMKIAAWVGTLYSAYNTVSNWSDMNDGQRVGGAMQTVGAGMGAASLTWEAASALGPYGVALALIGTALTNIFSDTPHPKASADVFGEKSDQSLYDLSYSNFNEDDWDEMDQPAYEATINSHLFQYQTMFSALAKENQDAIMAALPETIDISPWVNPDGFYTPTSTTETYMADSRGGTTFEATKTNYSEVPINNVFDATMSQIFKENGGDAYVKDVLQAYTDRDMSIVDALAPSSSKAAEDAIKESRKNPDRAYPDGKEDPTLYSDMQSAMNGLTTMSKAFETMSKVAEAQRVFDNLNSAIAKSVFSQSEELAGYDAAMKAFMNNEDINYDERKYEYKRYNDSVNPLEQISTNIKTSVYSELDDSKLNQDIIDDFKEKTEGLKHGLLENQDGLKEYRETILTVTEAIATAEEAWNTMESSIRSMVGHSTSFIDTYDGIGNQFDSLIGTLIEAGVAIEHITEAEAERTNVINKAVGFQITGMSQATVGQAFESSLTNGEDFTDGLIDSIKANAISAGSNLFAESILSETDAINQAIGQQISTLIDAENLNTDTLNGVIISVLGDVDWDAIENKAEDAAKSFSDLISEVFNVAEIGIGPDRLSQALSTHLGQINNYDFSDDLIDGLKSDAYESTTDIIIDQVLDDYIDPINDRLGNAIADIIDTDGFDAESLNMAITDVINDVDWDEIDEIVDEASRMLTELWGEPLRFEKSQSLMGQINEERLPDGLKDVYQIQKQYGATMQEILAMGGGEDLLNQAKYLRDLQIQGLIDMQEAAEKSESINEAISEASESAQVWGGVAASFQSLRENMVYGTWNPKDGQERMQITMDDIENLPEDEDNIEQILALWNTYLSTAKETYDRSSIEYQDIYTTALAEITRLETLSKEKEAEYTNIVEKQTELLDSLNESTRYVLEGVTSIDGAIASLEDYFYQNPLSDALTKASQPMEQILLDSYRSFVGMQDSMDVIASLTAALVSSTESASEDESTGETLISFDSGSIVVNINTDADAASVSDQLEEELIRLFSEQGPVRAELRKIKS